MVWVTECLKEVLDESHLEDLHDVSFLGEPIPNTRLDQRQPKVVPDTLDDVLVKGIGFDLLDCNCTEQVSEVPRILLQLDPSLKPDQPLIYYILKLKGQV